MAKNWYPVINEKTCTECSCTAEGCCEDTTKRKIPTKIICLAVLLAVIGILSYKFIFANNNKKEAAGFGFAQSGIGLESLNALNAVAMDKDLVFIFVPGSDNDAADDKTNAAVLSAQQSLKTQNVNAGLFNLPQNSPDYPIIAGQIHRLLGKPPPAVLVAVKGGGLTVVPCNDITEENLLYAYLSCCESGSSCCPQ